MQALEGVLAVEEAALVHLAEVALDVGAGQRGAAEQHRDVGQALLVQLLEVLAHDQRALHEQAAHADGVGADTSVALSTNADSGALMPMLCTS